MKIEKAQELFLKFSSRLFGHRTEYPLDSSQSARYWFRFFEEAIDDYRPWHALSWLSVNHEIMEISRFRGDSGRGLDLWMDCWPIIHITRNYKELTAPVLILTAPAKRFSACRVCISRFRTTDSNSVGYSWSWWSLKQPRNFPPSMKPTSSLPCWQDPFTCPWQQLWGALSDEKTGLSFVYASGPCQRSLSRVRVHWDSRPYFIVSDLRLPFSSPPTTRRVTVEVLLKALPSTGCLHSCC
jgi:hypothetical protein